MARPLSQTDILRHTGLTYEPVPGILVQPSTTSSDSSKEVSYKEFSTGGLVSTVTATTFNTAATLVTADAFNADGSKYKIEFFVPAAWTNATTYQVNFSLSEGGTELGVLCRPNTITASGGVMGERVLTPSAGSHTYSVVAYLSSAGTGNWISDVGGAGKLMPGYLRVMKA